MSRLQNKIAVVTGGTSGIGFAIAKEFIAEGAKVLITGRDISSLDNALQELGTNAVGITADTADPRATGMLYGQVARLLTNIDTLVINAGIARFASIEEVTEAMYDEQFNTNVKGAYFTIQQLLPLMKAGGSIILMTSINAHIGRPHASVYSATKGALLTMAKTLSSDLLPRRIRVNAISPGPIATLFRNKLGLPQEQTDQLIKDTVNAVPLKRLGTTEEVARIAVFFASDDSGFVLGAELIADGGMGSL